MPRKSLSAPRYCHQKENGRPDRAYTIVSGKRVHLGNYGSPESYERYTKAINEPKVEKPVAEPAPTAFTISMLLAAYLEFAIERYGGEKAMEVVHAKLAAKVLRRTHGNFLTRDFGPKAFKAMRRAMVENTSWCRGYINEQCQRVKRIVSWGVSEEILPPSARHALDSVEPLQMGQFGVREGRTVKPVPDAIVDATIACLSPIVADMVRLMRLTGMRSGELLQLSAEHVDRKGEVWLFTPPRHKTRRHGKQRIVAIGPKAQAVLSKYLFSTPCFPYETASYRRAITRACDRAFPHPELSKAKKAELTKEQATALRQWKKQHRWHPHQLRHAAATAIRETLGLDFAQATLGHARADMTQHYAAVNQQKAREAALQIG
ncbi:MAG TPA: tyrosine-type recombinase/integrase [Lacipirellulaceae bacterium]|nr:tyrosine-type recombinase/integrase [Lacipirellulaceae bacterium]